MNTLEQRIDYLEKRVAELERARTVYGPIPEPWPNISHGAGQPGLPSGAGQPWNNTPYQYPPGFEPSAKCPKCGIDWKGAMGYSCPRDDCVMQPKVTC